MKMNKKAVKTIFLLIGAIVILGLFYYFVFFLPAYSAITTVIYAQNKLALILACLEDYKKNHGCPPDRLSQIQEKINEYLLKNPDFSNKYLFPAWTSKEVPLFTMPAIGKGWMIKHNELKYMRDGEEYYLYFWRDNIHLRTLTIREIKDIILKCDGYCRDYSGLVIAHNGKIVFGMMSKNIDPFTFENINNYLRGTERQKTFVWYIFEQ